MTIMTSGFGRWRVDLLTILPMAIVVLPSVGLLFVWLFPSLSPFPLGTTASYVPLVLCGIFAVLFIWALLKTLAELSKLRPLTATAPAGPEVRPNILILLAVATFLLTLSQVDVIALFAGDIYKGDLRVHGQLLAILTKFVMPTLFAYTGLTWRQDQSRARMHAVIAVGLITFISAFLLGTKAGSLIAILPGILVLVWRGVSMRVFLGMTLACLVVVLVASSLFDTSGQGLAGSLGYVLRRLFMLTAEIPYRITVAALTGDAGIDYPRTLLSIMTNFVLRQFIETPLDLYTYSFSGAVSGLFYPELIPQISSGEWNHTPPVYSEGIVAFGPLFGLMALVAGSIGGALIYVIRSLAASQRLILTSLLLTYFVFVYVAWLNSAGIAGLVHPFPLLALVGTGLALFTLRQVQRNVRQQKLPKAV